VTPRARPDDERARTRTTSGFTLIELLIAITIIGVLAALLIPTLGSAARSAQRSGATQTIRQIANALMVYRVQERVLPPEQGVQWTAGVPTWDPGVPATLRERVSRQTSMGTTGSLVLDLLERVADMQLPGEALRPNPAGGVLDLTDPWRQPIFYQRVDEAVRAPWKARCAWWSGRTPPLALAGAAGERTGFALYSVGEANLANARTPPDPADDSAVAPGGRWQDPARIVYLGANQ
jgi:prepilin-type N-terminal cleavage/methylation domain-containing protein